MWRLMRMNKIIIYLGNIYLGNKEKVVIREKGTKKSRKRQFLMQMKSYIIQHDKRIQNMLQDPAEYYYNKMSYS